MEEVRETKVDFNLDFVQRIIQKMDWPVLHEAAKTLNLEVPPNPPQTTDGEEVLKKVHHALFEVEVIRGELVCPETGRKFPIKQGIPNMLCNEDEV